METKITDSLVLAYLGDAVYSLYVRERLADDHVKKVRYLHEQSRKIVSAKIQAIAARKLLPSLSDEESAVFLRGRNTKSPVPRSATVSEYRAATGLEALFGYLYTGGRTGRLRDLMELAFNSSIDMNHQ